MWEASTSTEPWAGSMRVRWIASEKNGNPKVPIKESTSDTGGGTVVSYGRFWFLNNIV